MDRFQRGVNFLETASLLASRSHSAGGEDGVEVSMYVISLALSVRLRALVLVPVLDPVFVHIK